MTDSRRRPGRSLAGAREKLGAALVVGALAFATVVAGALSAPAARGDTDPTGTPTSTPTDTATPTEPGTPTTTARPPSSPSSTRTTPRSSSQGGDAPSSGSSDTPSPDTLAVAVQSMSPAMVTPTATLRIRGTVTNTGTSPVRNGAVRLLVHHSPLISRTLVAQWASGDIADVGGLISGAGDDLPVELGPGESASFTIKVAGSLLGLQADYESIGVTLEALGDDGSPIGTHRLGLLRTFITWQQRAAYKPLRLSWLLPITSGPTSATGGPPDEASLAAAVGPGSRLADVVSALEAAPGGQTVSIAMDPSLVADLQAQSAGAAASSPGRSPTTSSSTASSTSTAGSSTGGTSGTTNGTTNGTGAGTAGAARSTIRDYLTSLQHAAAGRTMVQLPFGDPDLMGLADNDGVNLLTASAQAGGTGAASVLHSVFGVDPVTDLGWPATGWADPATVSAAKSMRLTSLVLNAASRPPDVPQVVTPSGNAPLSGSLSATLYDPTLSTLLNRTSNAGSGALTVQRFLAETMAIVGEHPSRSRILLVVAARSFDPDPATARSLFTALAGAPWVAGASLAKLRAGQGGDQVPDRSAAPIPASTRRNAISKTQVSEVKAARTLAAQLATVIPGDQSLTQTRTNALRLVGTRFRGRPAAAATGVKSLRDNLMEQGGRVHILPLSTLNFLASDGNLTLSVANDLGLDVEGLRVVVQSQSGRLVVVKQPRAFSVDAGRRTSIRVHMHAVAAGVVPVTARIVTPNGTTLGTPVQVRVRVRPTDTWAFWALGGASGVVFVVGLVRTLRRGRAHPRLAAPDVVAYDRVDPYGRVDPGDEGSGRDVPAVDRDGPR